MVVVLAVVVFTVVVEEASMVAVFAVVVSAAEQDSVPVDQWGVSPNVTMQIGTAIGTGGMSISSAIGSLFLTTASGLGFILGIITIRTTTRIITDTIHIRCRWSVPSNRTWPGKATIAV